MWRLPIASAAEPPPSARPIADITASALETDDRGTDQTRHAHSLRTRVKLALASSPSRGGARRAGEQTSPTIELTTWALAAPDASASPCEQSRENTIFAPRQLERVLQEFIDHYHTRPWPADTNSRYAGAERT